MGKVDKYGLARTQQIIQKYADQGRLTAELEARMLRFARLYATSKPQPAPAGQQSLCRPAAARASGLPAEPGDPTGAAHAARPAARAAEPPAKLRKTTMPGSCSSSLPGFRTPAPV